MKPIIAISMGEPAGIGAEITVKALQHSDIYDRCTPVVVGDYEALKDAISFCHSDLKLNKINSPKEAKGDAGVLDFIDMGFLEEGGWEYKKNTALGGKASFNYVKKVIELAMDGEVDATVTGPISKESLHLAGYNYAGHTEIYADLTGTKDYAMLLTSPSLRVIHCTTHVSMRNACDLITKERVLRTIKLADLACRMLGIENPRIAVAGLNAHCSENGLFGWEEEKEIIPAIEEAKAMGYGADGPVPPDTVFVKAMANQYDIVVAMYHDQGHIPLKISGFKLDYTTNTYTSMTGVNSTIGLPIVRTSVDHGTAFGKAGEGRANEESMVDSIDMAIVMANHMKETNKREGE